MEKNNRHDMPNSKEILEFWQNSKEINKPFLINATEKTCFACGWNVGTQRCHINPLIMGGNNDLENLHLLCRHCHYESERLNGIYYFKWFNKKSFENSANFDHVHCKLEMIVPLIKDNVKRFEYLGKNQIISIIHKFYNSNNEYAFLSYCNSIKPSEMFYNNDFEKLIFEAICICEQKTISFATKDALQRLKASGVKLGNPKNLTAEAQLKGLEANRKKAKANPNNIKAMAIIKNCLIIGGYTFIDIARILNDQKIKTSQGTLFRYIQVKRLAERIEKDPDYFELGKNRIANLLQDQQLKISA